MPFLSFIALNSQMPVTVVMINIVKQPASEHTMAGRAAELYAHCWLEISNVLLLFKDNLTYTAWWQLGSLCQNLQASTTGMQNYPLETIYTYLLSEYEIQYIGFPP